MELAIRPEDVHAASVVLARCAADLADAGAAFARRAAADIPDIGAKASAATEFGVARATHIVEVLGTDVARLSQSLEELAHAYPRVDASAVPSR